jgi:N-glycosylase/DNA lyase
LSTTATWYVFHRNTVENQVKVTRKALAYVELIITTNCRHLVEQKTKVSGSRANHVKAYLDTLTIRDVNTLKEDTSAAMEDMEDSVKFMAVYRTVVLVLFLDVVRVPNWFTFPIPMCARKVFVSGLELGGRIGVKGGSFSASVMAYRWVIDNRSRIPGFSPC